MNRLEKVFYEHLLSTGLKKEEIKFFKKDSPDFVVNGKIGYEVKKKDGNGIVLSEKQIVKILDKNLQSSIIVINDDKKITNRIELNNSIFNIPLIDGLHIWWKKDGKLVPFFQKINRDVVFKWKETITQNERIKERLEEALKKDTEEHKNE